MKLSWVNSISRPVEPSRLEFFRAIWAKPSSRHHQMEKACLVGSLWFHQVCPCWVPLSVFVLRSPAEVHLRTIWRRQLLHITTPWRQPDPMARSTVVNGLTFGGSTLTLFKVVAQGWGHLRASSWVWGILVHPSPPVQAYLWTTSFIGRISPVYTWGRRDLCSDRGSQMGTDS